MCALHMQLGETFPLLFMPSLLNLAHCLPPQLAKSPSTPPCVPLDSVMLAQCRDPQSPNSHFLLKIYHHPAVLGTASVLQHVLLVQKRGFPSYTCCSQKEPERIRLMAGVCDLCVFPCTRESLVKVWNEDVLSR